ncbi:hypothetical protein B0I35DRAFT_35685 [Stachybotrys elegans]|uniref:Uncharacterized protein n=1 Tax=Stachybotrys elegans TaxID=80388 RepID=A0A8K0T6M8_9HYPO|nr:hypothetical protein B0I35DRAFT_35685 [Stachybotrys elegans]
MYVCLLAAGVRSLDNSGLNAYLAGRTIGWPRRFVLERRASPKAGTVPCMHAWVDVVHSAAAGFETRGGARGGQGYALPSIVRLIDCWPMPLSVRHVILLAVLLRHMQPYWLFPLTLCGQPPIADWFACRPSTMLGSFTSNSGEPILLYTSVNAEPLSLYTRGWRLTIVDETRGASFSIQQVYLVGTGSCAGSWNSNIYKFVDAGQSRLLSPSR